MLGTTVLINNLSTILLTLLVLVLFCHNVKGIPNLNETSQEAILVFTGEDAFIDCKVKNQQNYTILFKFMGNDPDSHKFDLLTAGNIIVTSDTRFSILHQKEHDVWVLNIKNTRLSDSGIYMCETNSKPQQKIARLLTVIDSATDTTDKTLSDTVLAEINHNYTECCIDEDVPELCHPFCLMSAIVNNDIPQRTVRQCLPHFPGITRCLNGGRDNLQCCRRQNIPVPCESVCVGNFTLNTVTDHFQCMDYAAPVLACIAEGIETLPAQPLDVMVEPISTTELKVKWFKTDNPRDAPADSYQINATQLHTFDDLTDTNSNNNKKLNNLSIKDNSRSVTNGTIMSVTVNATVSEWILKDMKPFTMYEIQMKAINKFGSSLPTNSMRVLTLAPETDVQKIPKSQSKTDPKLPNIRKCCKDNGVVLDRCLDTMCDPVRTETASLSDLMICAPWANVTFKCMSLETTEDGFTDHSSCCQQRGVSPVCMSLCKGNVKRIDFRHFICLEHMSTYTNCILSHHKVLASEPQDFRVSNVHHNWAIVKWRQPKKLAHTVTKYYIHWRETSSESPNIYQVDVASRSPHLIDNLKPGYRYEAFVSAVNDYGSSEGSVRVIFSTPGYSTADERELDESHMAYNETACCLRASLPKKCQPLCSYKVKVQDVFNLSSICVDSLATLVRCATGGRNHVPCCRRRDVSSECLNVCAGLVDTAPLVTANRCSQDFGRILQCMEEGTGLLPGMPIGLHANYITKNSVHLQWKPALEDMDAKHVSYQVRYGKTDNMIPLHPLDHTNTKNATQTKAIIDGLQPNTHYSVYITAHNLYGVSLPSLVLLIKTSDSDESDQRLVVHSKTGPPHSLELIRQTVDTITMKWLPPLYVPIDTTISYIVYYKAINGTALTGSSTMMSTNPDKNNWFSLYTPYTTIYLKNLTYNTEYALAVQAVTDRNDTSSTSEIVLVWTDPAIPTALQMPLIIPAGPIVEGTNITVMCIAMGTPVPKTSLFVNGILVGQQNSRHMAYTLANVNRNLTVISCYAVNGEGKDAHSAQSSLDVYVRFKPSAVVTAPQVTTSAIGATTRLFCIVSGNPQPRVFWYKQNNTDIVQIYGNNNYNFITVPHSEFPMTYVFTLLIKSTQPADDGNYMCTTENDFGKLVTTLTLQVTEQRVTPRNSTSCCVEQGVSQQCLGVCSLDVDIESALSRPECFGELDKLMNCAADGSDHRQCCRRRQVPNGCLRWCAGLRVGIPSLCVLSSAREIISCFQEGRALLPGPPINIQIGQFIGDNTIRIEWTPPEKNAELVQWYRVFWRPVGSRDLMRNQTDGLSFDLTNLEADKMYEFVVKSGNHYGLSVFTDPLVVSLTQSPLHSTSLGNKLLKVMLGIAVGTVLLIMSLTAIIYYYKFYYITNKSNPTRGVSFENPTYLKDTNTIQFNDTTSGGSVLNNNNNNGSGNGVHNGVVVVGNGAAADVIADSQT